MKYWTSATIVFVAAFVLFGCSGTESSTVTDPGSKDQGSIQNNGAIIEHGESYSFTTLDCEGNPIDVTIADNFVIRITTNADGTVTYKFNVKGKGTATDSDGNSYEVIGNSNAQQTVNPENCVVTIKNVYRFRLVGKGKANNTWYTGHTIGWFNYCTGESDFKISKFEVECR